MLSNSIVTTVGYALSARIEKDAVGDFQLDAHVISHLNEIFKRECLSDFHATCYFPRLSVLHSLKKSFQLS